MTSETGEDLPASLFVTFVGLLLAIGTLMVYSASITARPSAAEQVYLARQLAFLLFTGMAGITASQIPGSLWRRAAWPMFCGTLLLLIAVLFPGVGTTVNGAQRWIRVGPISIQPSETAKLTIPLVLAAMRTNPDCSRLMTWGALFLSGAAVVLTAAEPDLGTSLFLALSAALVLFLSGWPWKIFLLGGGLLVPVVGVLIALQPYQLARVQGFIATWTQPESAPYQIQQSLTTLGVGGWTGVGLGRGWQKLSFLPEANTDFIFAVIGEELGLLGTLSVIGLWIGFAVTGWRLVRRVNADSFQGVLATVLIVQLIGQAMINMAVVTALLPPKGISHPFISYGGSNLVVSVVSAGLVLSLTRLPQTGDIRDNTAVRSSSRSSSPRASLPHAVP